LSVEEKWNFQVLNATYCGVGTKVSGFVALFTTNSSAFKTPSQFRAKITHMKTLPSNAMKSIPNCRFCGIVAGERGYGRSDAPFYENADFFAIASIGALVEGWSLVVPKPHAVSLRDFYGTDEFKSFSTKVVERVRSVYGNAVVFEHGSNHEGSLTSCGTDHAHLHVVPLTFSLRQDLLESGLSWQEVKSSEISATAGGQEYLFYCDNLDNADPVGLLHVLRQPISQFFRKMIAAKLGKLDVADYKQHLHLVTSENTQSRLVVATA
jgi:ATP adenylyltransferase